MWRAKSAIAYPQLFKSAHCTDATNNSAGLFSGIVHPSIWTTLSQRMPKHWPTRSASLKLSKLCVTVNLVTNAAKHAAVAQFGNLRGFVEELCDRHLHSVSYFRIHPRLRHDCRESPATFGNPLYWFPPIYIATSWSQSFAYLGFCAALSVRSSEQCRKRLERLTYKSTLLWVYLIISQ